MLVHFTLKNSQKDEPNKGYYCTNVDINSLNISVTVNRLNYSCRLIHLRLKDVDPDDLIVVELNFVLFIRDSLSFRGCLFFLFVRIQSYNHLQCIIYFDELTVV